MRGHLVQRGDRYYAVVYEGIDPATGKERHRWYPAGSTRKGAEKVIGDLVNGGAEVVTGGDRQAGGFGTGLLGIESSIPENGPIPSDPIANLSDIAFSRARESPQAKGTPQPR